MWNPSHEDGIAKRACRVPLCTLDLIDGSSCLTEMTIMRSEKGPFVGRSTLWNMATAGLAICVFLSGCRSRNDLLHYVGKERTAEYFNRATAIAHPNLDETEERFAHFAFEPRTVRNQREEETWDLSLAECIQICLSQSRIIRNQAQFASLTDPVLASPEAVPAVFDPAIQESGVLYGQRGVEAALSDFDAQFTTSVLWGRDEQVQNNLLSLGIPAGDVLTQNTAAFNMALNKQLATGGTVVLGHSWNYNGSNIGVPPLLFPSEYSGNVQLQFRQPLLAGAGVEYTRIAGPISDNLQGVSGVSQGVIIARINGDIALADFERNVQQMLHDLESLYWQLHMAYKTYDVQVRAREEALKFWRTVDFQIQGQTGSGGALEAELRSQYLVLVNQADIARDAIYAAESQLRLLMSLPVNDGRVIRPCDEPITAEFIPDWHASLANAYRHRPEIRRQKWNIRSLDFQRKAAENLTMPRLDFVSGYQINGFGDDLFDIGGGTSTGQYASAYRDLADVDQTGWNLGLQYSVPIGRRYAFSQLRSMELRLAKAQALLAEQETEISHQLAAVFRDLDRNYVTMENAYNRLMVARQRQRLTEAQYQNDPTQYPLESVARSQQALTEAELAFLTSQQQYNISIADLHFRTGETLLMNNIHLHEGPWKAEAESDAARNFNARKYARPSRLKFSSMEPVATVHD